MQFCHNSLYKGKVSFYVRIKSEVTYRTFMLESHGCSEIPDILPLVIIFKCVVPPSKYLNIMVPPSDLCKY